MLLKKLLFILVFILLFSFTVYSVDEPDLSAHSAVLINAQTKEVIYEKNAFQKRSMASTTKIMTSILALESGRLNETVTAKNTETEGTSIGLEDGYILRLEDLVWGMLLESGNDAAVLTAVHLSGSEKAFASLMNIKALEIGMADTNFVTASGLDANEHYSTAYDMALLGAYAVENPLFREMCSTKVKTVSFVEPDVSKTFSNHNKLLSLYEGAFGIKTGFIKKSGRCLVSACERDNAVLVAVTLNAPDDWNDHIKLYDYGFAVCKATDMCIDVPDCIRVYGGNTGSAAISYDESAVIISLKDTDDDITRQIYLPEFIYAPVSKGDILGKVEILRDNKVIAGVSLVSAQDITALEPIDKHKNFFQILYNNIKEFFINRKGK